MAATLNDLFAVHLCQQSQTDRRTSHTVALTTAVSVNSPYGRFSFTAAGSKFRFNGALRALKQQQDATLSVGGVRVSTTRVQDGVVSERASVCTPPLPSSRPVARARACARARARARARF